MAIPEIRTAVVGVGFIGELHVRLYDEHHRTNVAVVVDRDEERARTVAESYGVDSVETDLETTLERYDLDAVTIATPEATHRELVETALDHDVAVLLEKPIADSMADAGAIGAATDQSDGQLLMGFVCRFDPRYGRLRERIAGGELGEVYAVSAARIVNRAVYERTAGWTHPMYYLSVHDIDMMRWCVGAEIESVYAEASGGLGDADTPAAISATLRFEDGTVGTLEANLGRPDAYPTARTDELRVTGTEGYGRVVNEPGAGIVVTDDAYDFVEPTELRGRRVDMFRFELDHFVDVADGDPPLATWQDGLSALAVANAIIESTETGDPVSIGAVANGGA